MTLYVVSTPIGNLDDVTLRALAVLSEVDRVYAEDTRRTRILCDRHGIATPLRSLHEHNEAARIPEVLRRLEDGGEVALVTDAGTPLVSDPGGRLVAAVIEAGHRVVPVPGASAALAALVASGLPADRFTFVGFLPRKASARRELLRSLATDPGSVIVYEAPGRLEALLGDLADAVGADRRIAVARELTKLHEEVFRGTVAEAGRHFTKSPPRGEITVVVGPSGDPETPDVDGARTFAAARLAEGATATDVVRDVMDEFGLRKNAAYALVQAVKE